MGGAVSQPSRSRAPAADLVGTTLSELRIVFSAKGDGFTNAALLTGKITILRAPAALELHYVPDPTRLLVLSAPIDAQALVPSNADGAPTLIWQDTDPEVARARWAALTALPSRSRTR